VDPVSHVVMGRLVVASIDRGGRAGTAAAAMVGALVPDVDLVLMPFGWDVYLRCHEVGTHSIAGACVLGGMVGAVVYAIVAAYCAVISGRNAASADPVPPVSETAE